MFARQRPNIKERIHAATETENFVFVCGLAGGRALIAETVRRPVNEIILIVKPVVEVRGIQFVDIQFSEGNCFLEVKSGIVCADSLHGVQCVFKLFRSRAPVSENNFPGLKFFEVKRALIGVISGIENSRNAENLRNEEIFPVISSALTVDDSPANVVNQRLGDANGFTLCRGQVCDMGKTGRFTIQNQEILPALIQFYHFLLPTFI